MDDSFARSLLYIKTKLVFSWHNKGAFIVKKRLSFGFFPTI